MNWLNATNLKRIGTFYLILVWFAGIIGLEFSVLFRLELYSPRVQFLQGDHQLFNLIICSYAIIMTLLFLYIHFLNPTFPRLKNISFLLLPPLLILLWMISLLFIKKIRKNIREQSKFNLVNFTNKIKRVIFSKSKNIYLVFIKYMDLLLLVIVISFLMNDLMSAFISTLKVIDNYFNLDFIYYMSKFNNGSSSASNINIPDSTTVNIINGEGSWSNAVRSLIIYVTAWFRLHLASSDFGNPGSRAFIIVSILSTDNIARFLANNINDPEFVKEQNHYFSWKAMWQNSSNGEARIDLYSSILNNFKKIISSSTDSSTSSYLNKFLPDNLGYEELINKFIKSILDIVLHLFEPIKADYSNEILANHINDLSIIMFILSIFICILILFLLLNIFVLLNSERITNFFTNKYIKWYVNVNMKLIGIEVFCLGTSILYFMYTLSKGLHFIATHPIVFS